MFTGGEHAPDTSNNQERLQGGAGAAAGWLSRPSCLRSNHRGGQSGTLLEDAMKVAMQTPRSGQSAMLTPPRPQKGQSQNPTHHPKGKSQYLPKAIGL